MARFLTGFIVASLLWSGTGYLYLQGELNPILGQLGLMEGADDPVPEATQASPDKSSKQKRKWRKKRRKKRRSKPQHRTAGRSTAATGNATTGDRIDWDERQRIDMDGGEEQLTGQEIEAGFDRGFSRIRRCLILVPEDAAVRGKLVFGMNVEGSGRVKAVNLSGPAAITRGESGGCLRKAARSIRFASFDGPSMLFRYPIELD